MCIFCSSAREFNINSYATFSSNLFSSSLLTVFKDKTVCKLSANFKNGFLENISFWLKAE